MDITMDFSAAIISQLIEMLWLAA